MRFHSFDSFNETYDYLQKYNEVTLDQLVHAASNIVKNPTIIYGIPRKTTSVFLTLNKTEQLDISKPFDMPKHAGIKGKYIIPQGRPVIVMYDNINYVIFEAFKWNILVDANLLKSDVQKFIKILDDKKELKTNDDYRSVMNILDTWRINESSSFKLFENQTDGEELRSLCHIWNKDEASRSATLKAMKAIIDRNPESVNDTTDNGEYTPLLLALKNEFFGMAKFLIENGADPNLYGAETKNYDSQSPFNLVRNAGFLLNLGQHFENEYWDFVDFIVPLVDFNKMLYTRDPAIVRYTSLMAVAQISKEDGSYDMVKNGTTSSAMNTLKREISIKLLTKILENGKNIDILLTNGKDMNFIEILLDRGCDKILKEVLSSTKVQEKYGKIIDAFLHGKKYNI